MTEATGKRHIRVLIVEDSPVVQQLLVHLFESDPETVIAGVASDGEEGVKAVERLRPDVVTMDINMPRMNGFEATQLIMQRFPTPIVIVSGSWDQHEVQTTFRAVESGALALLPRPHGVGHPDFEPLSRELVKTVKALSEVKVVRRRPRTDRLETPAPPSAPERARDTVGIVAIGASTGGPNVLQTILGRLTRGVPFPIAIVQHMAAGFSQGMTDWLTQTTGFPVQLATHGMVMQSGHAYLAPDGSHMRVAPGDRVLLSREPPQNGLRPSVGNLFRSVGQVYRHNALAILLTGMGTDGAPELKELRDMGVFTVAQDKASCVVNGMPGEAVKLEAASMILPPERIGDLIASMAAKPSISGTGGLIQP